MPKGNRTNPNPVQIAEKEAKQAELIEWLRVESATVDQVCERFEVHVTTVRRWLNELAADGYSITKSLQRPHRFSIK